MKKRILTLTLLGILLIGFISISTSSPHKEIHFYEAPVEVEEWMTQPFETVHEYFAEDTLEIEDWMTHPFV